MIFPQQFKHATVLITGATAGIGLEFARLCAPYGFALILVGRNPEKLALAREEMLAAGAVDVETVVVDLSGLNAADTVFRATEGMGRTVDILINNAGKGLFGETSDQSVPDTDSMLRLNIETLTNLCILFSKPMAERGKGLILNVGSMTGFLPVPMFSAYAASKAYVFNYSLALAAELRKRGVSVTCLVPGFTRTNFEADIGIKSEAYTRFSRKFGMNPSRVARIGLRSLFRKRAYVIPGLSNKLAFAMLHFFPGKTIARIIYSVISGMITHNR